MHGMNEGPIGRITPWVGRLLALNAVVMLLQETLFTSDAITDALLFEPELALQRPWTFVTYMILHGSLFHLIGNSIALYAFGPAVERDRRSQIHFLYLIAVSAPRFFRCGFTLIRYAFLGASGGGLAWRWPLHGSSPMPPWSFSRSRCRSRRGVDHVIIALDWLALRWRATTSPTSPRAACSWVAFFATQKFANPGEAPRLPPSDRGSRCGGTTGAMAVSGSAPSR